jgi:hypothetical protein
VDPLGSVEHILGTTVLGDAVVCGECRGPEPFKLSWLKEMKLKTVILVKYTLTAAVPTIPESYRTEKDSGLQESQRLVLIPARFCHQVLLLTDTAHRKLRNAPYTLAQNSNYICLFT